MTESPVEPTARSWIEKAYDVGYLPAAVFLSIVAIRPLTDALGYWPAVAVGVAISLALLALTSLSIGPVKRERSARDAERGIFECLHRETESPLKGRWAAGYAKAEPGRLLFQARTGATGGPLLGPLETYTDLRAIGQPAKAPWSVVPRGEIITLSTDKGVVELAGRSPSMQLLAERCLDNFEETP